MIKSKFFKLRIFNLRDNHIKMKKADQITESLKLNKTVIKMQFDYNPVKQDLLKAIEDICNRNFKISNI